MHMAESLYLNANERERLYSELRQNDHVQEFEVQLKRKDNSIWWGSANSYALKDDDGNMVGVEGIVRDVTARMEAEEELQKKSYDLGKRNKELECFFWNFSTT